jgi:hypothetical protein
MVIAAVTLRSGFRLPDSKSQIVSQLTRATSA